MDLEEGVCASCGKPLGPRANWHIPPGRGGRAFHNDCPIPPPEPDDPPSTGEPLGKFFERKARAAMQGRGQQFLDTDTPPDTKEPR
ncbi:MAG TPA: hypothetical protein VGV69_01150 [Solirubrobacterales bacterium]|nr:hypothetical protein [Solirubrobacterales bacterium]